MGGTIEIIKLWVKNNMFEYELQETKEGFFIYYNNDLVCFSKNIDIIDKAIEILGGLKNDINEKH